jgi:hypothetical protein
MADPLQETLVSLEVALQHGEVRAARARMDALLHPDLVEFGLWRLHFRQGTPAQA